MAKRKCGKQSPACLRCQERNAKCSYPSTKPGQQFLTFRLDREVDGKGPQNGLLHNGDNQLLSLQPSLLAIQRVRQATEEIEFCSHLYDGQSTRMWFNSSEAWTIDHFMPIVPFGPGVNDWRYLASKVSQWLVDWIDLGSNPFIHPELYRRLFPRCIQDAYTTLSCYLHKKVSNEEHIHQIIYDRATDLVQASEASSKKALETGEQSDPLDPFEHLARVQALLIYQIIGLYDGDIGLRFLAEKHISILHQWTIQMAESASRSADCLGKYLQGSVVRPDITALWFSWILSESIRRTWLVVSGMQSMYELLQCHTTIHCMGGMKFSARSGVWEANSALIWQNICSEMNVGMIHIGEAEALPKTVPLEDISEFTKVLLHVTLGTTKMAYLGF